MEIYEVGFFIFIYFFETLWKFFSFFQKFTSQNYYSDFRKSGTNGKSAHSPVCLHTPLISFYRTSISTDIKKV